MFETRNVTAEILSIFIAMPGSLLPPSAPRLRA